MESSGGIEGGIRLLSRVYGKDIDDMNEAVSSVFSNLVQPEGEVGVVGLDVGDEPVEQKIEGVPAQPGFLAAVARTKRV